MSEISTEQLEARLFDAGKNLAYPSGPDIARKLSLSAARNIYRRQARRRLALAAMLILAVIAALAAVPPVRAAVLDFFQIGVVRIFRNEPTHQPQSLTPQPDPTLLPSLLDLDGRITLDQALSQTDLPVLTPSSPRNFGPPDFIFLQDMGGPVLILVWTYPQQPEKIELSLHILSAGTWGVEKFAPRIISETLVNQQSAVWAIGPYMLMLQKDKADVRRLVDGNVLIWAQNGITYRLETELPMAEAIKAAESLQPVTAP